MKRPFITAGFTAFLLLIPLAATSTTASIRRLGSKWQLLHRLIYISATAAVIHFWWKVKADIRVPAIYASILALLLLFRVFSARFRGRSTYSKLTPQDIPAALSGPPR